MNVSVIFVSQTISRLICMNSVWQTYATRANANAHTHRVFQTHPAIAKSLNWYFFSPTFILSRSRSNHRKAAFIISVWQWEKRTQWLHLRRWDTRMSTRTCEVYLTSTIFAFSMDERNNSIQRTQCCTLLGGFIFDTFSLCLTMYCMSVFACAFFPVPVGAHTISSSIANCVWVNLALNFSTEYSIILWLPKLSYHCSIYGCGKIYCQAEAVTFHPHSS